MGEERESSEFSPLDWKFGDGGGGDIRFCWAEQTGRGGGSVYTSANVSRLCFPLPLWEQ